MSMNQGVTTLSKLASRKGGMRASANTNCMPDRAWGARNVCFTAEAATSTGARGNSVSGSASPWVTRAAMVSSRGLMSSSTERSGR